MNHSREEAPSFNRYFLEVETEETFRLFELKRLLIGEQIPYSFLLEVLARSAIMFLVTLVILRMSGKRGIKQLSIFELAILISLGSAAGDPMFYQEVGLLPAIAVLCVVITLYKCLTYLSGKFESIEKFVEGKPIKLIEEGRILQHVLQKETLAYDELFSQLRQHSISHLGQIKTAYLETSGDLSIYYFADQQTDDGLPILPELYDHSESDFDGSVYACKLCGNTAKLHRIEACTVCAGKEWVKAIKTTRIS